LALEGHYDDAQTVVAYATWLDWTGQNRQAVPLLRKVLSIQPHDHDVVCQLAWALVDVGENLDEAEQWLKLAMQQNPNSSPVADTRAWLHYRRGEYHRAMESLKSALPLVNKHPEIAYHAGAIFAKLDENDQAITYLRMATQFRRVFSGRQDAFVLLARLESQRL
jgi:Tfp pilus assembly protein PilF